MGRHSASYIKARQAKQDPGQLARIAAVGLLSTAIGSFGVGAALVGGGVAHAEDTGGGSDKQVTHSAPSTKAATGKKVAPKSKPGSGDTVGSTATARQTRALKPTTAPSASTKSATAVKTDTETVSVAVSTLAPPKVSTSLTKAPIEAAAAAGTQTAPAATDQVATQYGNIGKWMLNSFGSISNYGGQKYDGKKLLEPVNVIIVDPTSTSATAAKQKLATTMTASGFPARAIHSGGFQGIIDGKRYRQQPTGFLQAYSDNDYTKLNDHGRIFGPDPVQTTGGYVWSGAFSTEKVSSFFFGIPLHSYASSNAARTALAAALLASGLAVYGGMVELNNSYNTDKTTTGDHDGQAVVLILK